MYSYITSNIYDKAEKIFSCQILQQSILQEIFFNRIEGKRGSGAGYLVGPHF